LSHPNKIPAALRELAARARHVADSFVSPGDRSVLIDVAKGFETSAGALEAAEAKVAHIEAAAMRAGLSRRAEMIRRRADEARGVELWERLLAVAASLDDLAASSEQCGIEIGHSSPAPLQSGGVRRRGR